MVTRGGTDPQNGPVRSWLPLTAGLLAVVVGALWTVQGLGYVPGSLMTGHRVWVVVGPVLVLAGLLLLRRALAARRR
ncbi:hypothetical protein [Micromonospora echinofusca]|uniref:MYXO-CTERM domain-containing protein n=1 Tax=Micromonospora echinofusca TaxID=47858 RepID=A0ABS3VXS2_MICEH|nr:hypothetical protein [Micromonospora echinofusca]MBO4209345.1 hypothetical protein [Micromonospora echinofusca]